MAKMNQPIRMTKAITGHKSATPIKGDTANYKITTNVGDTEGTIKETDGTLVGTVGGSNLKATMQRVREALVSLGVKFPILQAADVPATTEEQLVAFSAIPDAGAFTLTYESEETASIAFDDLAADVQAALRALPGLEEVTVTGDFDNGFSVLFVGVPGDVAMLAEGANTLEESATPVTITITEEEAGS